MTMEPIDWEKLSRADLREFAAAPRIIMASMFPKAPLRIVLVLWEPRWHGFARWTLIEQRDTGAETELDRGWWRPPPGWRWQEIVVRDYDGAPLQWLPFMRGHILGRVDAELQADAP